MRGRDRGGVICCFFICFSLIRKVLTYVVLRLLEIYPFLGWVLVVFCGWWVGERESFTGRCWLGMGIGFGGAGGYLWYLPLELERFG